MVTNRISFACQCFGPGLPREGRRAEAETQTDELVITVEGRLIRLPWKTCQVDGTGIDNQQIALNWRGDGGKWTVVPAAEDAFAALIENAPLTLRQKLAPWQQDVKGGRRGFPWVAVTIALATLLSLLALGLYLTKMVAAPEL